MIHDIPAYNYAAFLVEIIKKMNRRAVKLGCEPCILRVVRQYEEERKSRTGAKYIQSRMEIELFGETPKLAGWSLLAAVEMLDNGENLVRTVPGRTVPEVYRTTDTHCDHCKSDRKRKKVFILGHDDIFVQVGRQCLADFLGHASAESLAARAEWELSLEALCSEAGDEDFCGRRAAWVRDITEYLVTVAIVVRRLGWVSNKMAQERCGVSTSSLAWQVLTDYRSRYTQELIAEKQLYAEARDEKLAQEALAWARVQPTTGVSDYIYNLGVACRQEFVSYRTIGIVASAIVSYHRSLDRKAGRQHLSEVGKRTDFEGLVVKRMRYFESQYGVRTLITFEDAGRNVLIWWASKELDDVAEGDVVDIRGTVKVHGEYNGCPQTELQRVQIKQKKAPVATSEVKSA